MQWMHYYNVLTVSMPDPGGTAESSFFFFKCGAALILKEINLGIIVKKRNKILGFFWSFKGFFGLEEMGD